MKHFCSLTLAALFLLTPFVAFSQDETARKFESEDAKISYGFGMNLGRTLKDLPIKFDKDAFMQAIEDTMAGREPAVNEKDLQAAMLGFQQRVQEAQLKKQQELQAERDKQKPANLKQIQDFKKDPKVQTTDSGLKYRVLSAGEGESPMASDTVKVNYKGMLEDGTVFDSSYDRGSPATFQVSRVIPGWTEALQLMKPGAKYEVLIPSGKAYGPQPPQQSPIPPNANLFFEIELLEVL